MDASEINEEILDLLGVEGSALEESINITVNSVALAATQAAVDVSNFLDTKNPEYSPDSYREAFMNMLNNLSISHDPIDFNSYWELVTSLGFTPEQVNLHRTRNGYKNGTYKKTWVVPLRDGTQGSVEDNVVLLDFIAAYREEHKGEHPSFSLLSTFLDQTYRSMINN